MSIYLELNGPPFSTERLYINIHTQNTLHRMTIDCFVIGVP